MIPPAGKVLPEDPPVLRSEVELGPKIRAVGDEMERIRRIPPSGTRSDDPIARHRSTGDGRGIGWMVRTIDPFSAY